MTVAGGTGALNMNYEGLVDRLIDSNEKWLLLRNAQFKTSAKTVPYLKPKRLKSIPYL